MPDDDKSFQAGYVEGVNRFQSVRTRAFWQEVLSLFRGKPAELLSFDEIRSRLRLREESYKGLQDIPLDKIVGSVGRYRDFTADFLPKSGEMRERWSRVYAKATSMEGLPPIEVYKVGEVYFVRDGNHRVSVARELGAKTIEAHVTELPTSIPLRPGMSDEELDAAAAYANFLEETGLRRTRPHLQSIELSEPSRYVDLLGHIYLHARILEQFQGMPISTEEAAADWYDSVYRPAVTLIRKYGILDLIKDKSKRTEADLYLWLVDHLREVREQYGEEKPPARRFSDALVDYLTEQKIPVPKELLSEEDDTVIISRAQVSQLVHEAEARIERERQEREAKRKQQENP
jgi:uncharacterized ParB-like nuclease family protein